MKNRRETPPPASNAAGFAIAGLHHHSLLAPRQRLFAFGRPAESRVEGAHERARLVVRKPVVDGLAFTTRGDHARMPQSRQVLAQRGLRQADRMLQLTHRCFADSRLRLKLGEVTQDQQAFGIGDFRKPGGGMGGTILQRRDIHDNAVNGVAIRHIVAVVRLLFGGSIALYIRID